MSVAAVATTVSNALRPGDPGAVLTALLQQLRDVITLLPTGAYIARPAARVSGSVGEHVRHSLDHIAAVTDAMAGEELGYESRVRGTMVETDPAAAVNAIERLVFRLDRIPDQIFDRSVTVPIAIDPHSAPLVTRSSITRELAYVIHHTIHHFALIAVLLEWQGFHVPYGFGVAPGTLRARATG